MIWKDYLKLSEIANYSKLARASKAPPPPPPRRNGVNGYTKICFNCKLDRFIFSPRAKRVNSKLKFLFKFLNFRLQF